MMDFVGEQSLGKALVNAGKGRIPFSEQPSRVRTLYQLEADQMTQQFEHILFIFRENAGPVKHIEHGQHQLVNCVLKSKNNLKI